MYTYFEIELDKYSLYGNITIEVVYNSSSNKLNLIEWQELAKYLKRQYLHDSNKSFAEKEAKVIHEGWNRILLLGSTYQKDIFYIKDVKWDGCASQGIRPPTSTITWYFFCVLHLFTFETNTLST